MSNKKIIVLPFLFFGFVNFAFCQLSFSAKLNEDCSIELTWSLDENEDYDRFVIQWSEDGEVFNSIGEVEASVKVKNASYTFSDNFQSFYNYYRLKVVKKDGRVFLSNMIHEKNDCGIDGYTAVYPNPVVEKNAGLNVNFFTSSLTVDIVLYGPNNEAIKMISVATPKEWNAVIIDISDLEVGTYYIEVGDIGMSKLTVLEEKIISSNTK